MLPPRPERLVAEATHRAPGLLKPCPVSLEPALAAVEAGHVTGRAIARQLSIAESTLGLWRKRHPDFAVAIPTAMARERARRAAQCRQTWVASAARHAADLVAGHAADVISG